MPLGISLVTIPLYIAIIGDARYGVLAIAWLLLGYFGLFDLGLGRATAQRIAAIGENAAKQRAEIFWTALAMNSGLGILGGLILYPAAIYFFGKMPSPNELLQIELVQALPWLIAAVPLATLSGVLTGALQGRTRFGDVNVVSIGSSLLIQLVPLSAAWFIAPTLTWLLPSVILCRMLTMVVLLWCCRTHVFKNHPPSFSRIEAKNLLRYGGWVTLSSIISPMMVMLDRLLIGATLGAKAVTYYTVPFQLAERSAILPIALSSALFPQLAASSVTEAKRLAAKAIHSLASIMTPLILGAVILIEPFLSIWLGPDFGSHAGTVGQILLLGFWINSFARIPYALLQATGRPDIVAKFHLVELIPYLALLFIGLHIYGLVGAAFAFGIRALVDCILLMRSTGMLQSSAKILFAPILFLLVGLTIAVVFSVGAPVWAILVTGLFTCTVFWSWQNAPDEVRIVAQAIITKFRASMSIAIKGE